MPFLKHNDPSSQVADSNDTSHKCLWVALPNAELNKQLRTCTQAFAEWTGVDPNMGFKYRDMAAWTAEVAGISADMDRRIRLPLSRASKQQLGCRVVWLGACLAAGLGLVWLPREKAVHAAAALDTALRGEMAVSEYRRVLGFLVSLLFMMGGDKGLLHHIFRPVRPGEEIDSGPATLVFVDECMRPVLARWRALVLGTPGASTLSAVTPTAPPADTARHRIRTDAALEGTPSPGLGGWLYGLYFAVAIADVPGLETLDIPHLEFMAAALGCVIFAPALAGAAMVCLETDALATATSLTARARTPVMQVILDALVATREYQELAPRLLVSHCAGAGNPLADAASRGYADVLAALGAALGVTTTRAPLNDSARDFMRRALVVDLQLGRSLAAVCPHDAVVELLDETTDEAWRPSQWSCPSASQTAPSACSQRYRPSCHRVLQALVRSLQILSEALGHWPAHLSDHTSPGPHGAALGSLPPHPLRHHRQLPPGRSHLGAVRAISSVTCP